MLIDFLHRLVRNGYHHLGFESRYLQLDRCSMHYYQKLLPGSSFTLVLIHGLGTSSSTWVHLLPSLSKRYSIVSLDLPGYGLSTITKGEPFYRTNELVEAVEAVVQLVVSTPMILLGHSLGGWLAGWYAAKHPEQVHRLILVNNAGILYEGTEQQGKAFQVDTLGRVKELMDILWFNYPWYFRLFYRAIMHDLQKRHVAEFVQSVREEDFLNNVLGLLTMKTDLIWGRGDNLISAASIDIMRRGMPHLRVQFIERCGHVPQLERPKEFVRVVSQLLEEEGTM